MYFSKSALLIVSEDPCDRDDLQFWYNIKLSTLSISGAGDLQAIFISTRWSESTAWCGSGGFTSLHFITTLKP